MFGQGLLDIISIFVFPVQEMWIKIIIFHYSKIRSYQFGKLISCSNKSKVPLIVMSSRRIEHYHIAKSRSPKLVVWEVRIARMVSTITWSCTVGIIWGNMKNVVHKTNPHDLADLRKRIAFTIMLVTPLILITNRINFF